GKATAIADESDGLAGFGIPGRRGIRTACGEGEALGTVSIGVGDIEGGIATLHGGGKHDAGTVRVPCGGIVGAAETSEGDELSSVQGIHADLRADDAGAWGKAGEGDAGSVRGPTGGESYGMEERELMLVGAVV